jgi:hypothetical protein
MSVISKLQTSNSKLQESLKLQTSPEFGALIGKLEVTSFET